MSTSSGGGGPPISKTPGKIPASDKSPAKPGRELTDRVQREVQAWRTFASVVYSSATESRSAPARVDANYNAKPEHVQARLVPALQAPGPGGTATSAHRQLIQRAKSPRQGPAKSSAEPASKQAANNVLHVQTVTLEPDPQKSITAPSVPPAPTVAAPATLELRARAAGRTGVQLGWYDPLKDRHSQQKDDKGKGVDVEIDR